MLGRSYRTAAPLQGRRPSLPLAAEAAAARASASWLREASDGMLMQRLRCRAAPINYRHALVGWPLYVDWQRAIWPQAFEFEFELSSSWNLSWSSQLRSHPVKTEPAKRALQHARGQQDATFDTQQHTHAEPDTRPIGLTRSI